MAARTHRGAPAQGPQAIGETGRRETTDPAADRREAIELTTAAGITLLACVVILAAPLLATPPAVPSLSAPSPAAGFPAHVRDATGNVIVIPAPPRRIVSLAPSVTEILFALGLDAEIVGIGDADDYPPGRVAGKPRVGGVVINFERIVSLRSDLIVGLLSLQRDHLARLQAAGMRVLAVDAASVTQTLSQIRLLGRATGRLSAAEALVASMEQRIRGVRPAPRRRAYVEVWHEPLIAVAGETLVDDLLGRAGGVNIFGDRRGYPQVAAEAVVARDPEVILLLYPAPAPLARRPGWRTIDAVRAGRVYELPPDLVTRPGPRIPEGLLVVARTLQAAR